MSLEAILQERIDEAEGLLTSALGVNDEEKNILKQNKPKIIVTDKLGIYAAYDFLNNVYIFSRDAINNFLAIGEEVAHSIRLRLNSLSRNYFLNPLSRLRENIEKYIKAINLEEYFGRYGALIYTNYKRQTNKNSLWSRIKNYTIELFTRPFECITHFFGYRKAEADYELFGTTKFNKKALYSNDISQLEIPKLQLAA